MLRVGVVGLGMGKSHVHAYHAIPDVVVESVCDTNPDLLSRVATEFEVPHAVAQWEQLCDLKLDIISICTPDHLHYAMAKRALESGAHVVCEKPMTTSLEDALDLVHAVHRTGRHLAVGNVNRYEPQFRALRGLVEDDRLGELFMVEGAYIHDMRRVYRKTPWRTDPAYPQNAWFGGGVHPVDLVRWLAGEVVEITLYQNKVASAPEFPLPDNYVATLRFESGCLGRVWETSGIRRWPEHIVTLGAYGAEGTAIADTESRVLTAWLDPHDSNRDGPTRTPFSAARGHPVLEELRDIVASIRADRPPLVDVVDGARTIAVLDAGLQSVGSARPERVQQIA